MPGLQNLFRRFSADESGVFAVIFGLMAIVLIAMGGAVVDYVSVEQTRGRAQLALDAATLALQSEVLEGKLTETEIRTRAQALVQERVGTIQVGSQTITSKVDVIRTDRNTGTLYLEGEITVPMMFVSLVGVNSMRARFRSEAARENLALEVAFVLDNSGSMSFTGAGAGGTRQRMQFLRDAAKCATNILFFKDVVDDSSNPDTCIKAPAATQVADVQIGVVPFTMFVNVGAGNRTSGWIDQTGSSSIANDNFDNDDDESTKPSSVPNRFALFAATGEQWRGCVEARPATSSLDTNDVAPSSGDTLFVPLFSPDTLDGSDVNNYRDDTPAVCDRPAQGATTCTQRERFSGCNSRMDNRSCDSQGSTFEPSGPTNFSSNLKFTGGYYGAHAPTCSCRTYSAWGAYTQVSGSGDNRTFERVRTCSGGGYVPGGLSSRELQERVCKYYGGTQSSSFSVGPNANCTRTAILPLNNNPTTVLNTISGMTAEGGTNIHEGAAWGMRVLTPGAPFPAAQNSQTVAKALIIMTDGENTAYNLNTHCGTTLRSLNGNCYYSPYGFPYNSSNNNTSSTSGGNVERMGKFSPPTTNGAVGTTNASLVTEMNARTRETCESAKAAGITVYTIGLATSEAEQSSQAEVEDMLADCASVRTGAYFPQSPGELKNVFRKIAGELTQLRLTK